MQIRELTHDDLDTCIGLFIKEWSKPPYNEQWTEETARLRLTEILDCSHGTSLCVVIDDKIVGFAFCRLISWYDGKHGCIEEMIIDSRHQNQGVGTHLLQAVEENFLARGAVQIELLSFTQAHAFEFFKARKFLECDWKYLTKEV